MQQAIKLFAVINFLILGLSHVFQHRAWTEFFVALHGLGRPGAFANGFLSLFAGALIVGFHNVWSGIPILLTVIGWSFVLKAAVVFLLPEWGLRSMGRVRVENSRVFIVPGVILILVAAVNGVFAVVGRGQGMTLRSGSTSFSAIRPSGVTCFE